MFVCLPILSIWLSAPLLEIWLAYINNSKTDRKTDREKFGWELGEGRQEDIRIDRQAGRQTDRNIWLSDIKVFGTLVRSSNHMSYPGGVNHEINT